MMQSYDKERSDMKKESFWETLRRWRIKISQFLAHSALWLIASSIVLIIWVLIEAWLKGYLPDIHSWGEYEGNHGPWGFTLFQPQLHKFRISLETAFMFQIISVPISFISTVLKVSKYSIAVFAGSIITGGLSIYCLYWLID